MKFKEIHVGALIKMRVDELEIDESRLKNFLQLSETEISKTYEQESVDAKILLRWCKILNYDFFRIYSQHLIFYSPLAASTTTKLKTQLPRFRKHIYTKEIIDFVLQQIKEGKKTKNEVINDYKIPKTTLYKWLKKHN